MPTCLPSYFHPVWRVALPVSCCCFKLSREEERDKTRNSWLHLSLDLALSTFGHPAYCPTKPNGHEPLLFVPLGFVLQLSPLISFQCHCSVEAIHCLIKCQWMIFQNYGCLWIAFKHCCQAYIYPWPHTTNRPSLHITVSNGLLDHSNI